MKPPKLLACLLAVFLVFSPIAGAKAQIGDGENPPETPLTGAFSYQGYLTDADGIPYTDSCQFNVTLWDAPTLGNQIGATDTNPGIQVVDGYFSMTLNEANQFGAQPFNGEARYLEIAVGCPSAGTQELLSPRQLLRAAPYAVYSLTVPDHDHAGETWVDDNPDTILALENTHPMGGIGLSVKAAPGNIALDVDGGIRSTADIEYYLSPFDFYIFGDANTSASGDGEFGVRLHPGGWASLLLPLQIPGVLFGLPVFVKSLEICYRSQDPLMGITETAVSKNDGFDNPEVDYLSSTELQNSTDYTCYTVDAIPIYQVVDSSSFIWIELENTHATYDLSVIFYSIKLTLSENWN